MALAILLLWAWGVAQRGQRSQPTAAPAAAPDAAASLLPFTPAREEVRQALHELAPAVSACSHGESGVIRVHLTVAGVSGTVTGASVTKQFAGTDLARCAAKVVETAQFPRFRKKNLTVVFPYTLPGPPSRDGGTADAED